MHNIPALIKYIVQINTFFTLSCSYYSIYELNYVWTLLNILFLFYNFKGKTVSDGRGGSPDSISSLGSSASQKQPQPQQMQPVPSSMYANQPQQVYVSPQNPQHPQSVPVGCGQVPQHPHFYQQSGAGGKYLKIIICF